MQQCLRVCLLRTQLVDAQFSEVLYICVPDVSQDFPVERLEAEAKLWVFYGVDEDIGKDGNGEEKVDDDRVDDEGEVPVVGVEQLHRQGAKVGKQQQAQVPFEARWLLGKVFCFDGGKDAFEPSEQCTKTITLRRQGHL